MRKDLSTGDGSTTSSVVNKLNFLVPFRKVTHSESHSTILISGGVAEAKTSSETKCIKNLFKPDLNSSKSSRFVSLQENLIFQLYSKHCVS